MPIERSLGENFGKNLKDENIPWVVKEHNFSPKVFSSIHSYSILPFKLKSKKTADYNW
jgi:hypothetical protein